MVKNGRTSANKMKASSPLQFRLVNETKQNWIVVDGIDYSVPEFFFFYV